MAAMAERFPTLKDMPLRLDEKELKSRLGKNNFIFVGSSTDMFSEDIPAAWIIKTLDHCREYPKNKYIFQSKNPLRFHEFKEYFPINTILGTTIETDNASYEALNISKAPGIMARVEAMGRIDGFKKMITIEPIIDFNLDPLTEQIKACKPSWVNLGADSTRNGLPEPDQDKIKALVENLQAFTDIHEKSNLARLME